MALIDRPLEEQFGTKEAAKRLGISVKHLVRHVRAGRIRYINVALPESSRKQYRFTPYILKQFAQKQQQREVPASCQSIKAPKARSTVMTSNSTVVAFSALQKPGTKKKPKP
ncbi:MULTISPECIES: helix-turn-helix domain-containing protein [Mesorhizobium]|uniref:DNA-binding protein n=1 Tax=Mesorhizobium erdmanii TaxID=1777866 RepID=A0A6M7UDF0_9HYPH|nr:DNA-binding protein [Mesorhizobium erdmanii]